MKLPTNYPSADQSALVSLNLDGGVIAHDRWKGLR